MPRYDRAEYRHRRLTHEESVARRAELLCDFDEIVEQAAYSMAAQAVIGAVQKRCRREAREVYYHACRLLGRDEPVVTRAAWRALRERLDAWAIEAVGAERWRAQLRRAEACAGRLVDMLWRHQLDRRRARQRQVTPSDEDDKDT